MKRGCRILNMSTCWRTQATNHRSRLPPAVGCGRLPLLFVTSIRLGQMECQIMRAGSRRLLLKGYLLRIGQRTVIVVLKDKTPAKKMISVFRILAKDGAGEFARTWLLEPYLRQAFSFVIWKDKTIVKISIVHFRVTMDDGKLLSGRMSFRGKVSQKPKTVTA